MRSLQCREADDTLYKSLGGKKAITAVVDDFVGRVAADNRINSFFKATASDPKRLATFKKNLVGSNLRSGGRTLVSTKARI